MVVRSPITIPRRNTENGRSHIPLRTLTMVTAMLGGGVRALLIRVESRKPSVLLICRRISYSDQTVWKAKLHSTDVDGVPTPPFKCGIVIVQEMYSPGRHPAAKTPPTATGKGGGETRPSK